MSKNDDALLMHFWNYIIWMHFWFSFIGVWCTFDVVSKAHHQCRMFFEHFSKIFKKNLQNSENMMHFWCAFDALLKLHQKCTKNLWNYTESASKWCSFKSASKVHHCFPLKFQKILDTNNIMPSTHGIHKSDIPQVVQKNPSRCKVFTCTTCMFSFFGFGSWVANLSQQ